MKSLPLFSEGMEYRVTLHFPDGDPTEVYLDTTSCQSPYAKGQMVVIEGEEQTYRVDDVQQQLRRMDDGRLKQIMVNVILIKIAISN